MNPCLHQPRQEPLFGEDSGQSSWDWTDCQKRMIALLLAYCNWRTVPKVYNASPSMYDGNKANTAFSKSGNIKGIKQGSGNLKNIEEPGILPH
ncbi:hypothetical protein GDO78_005433 [Eleutherodactylus coqui]|uniref:Uncharacterized protein n=1 Tax=Eleutherodactylus coqui TaxID=57060 RepID=A0A8J6FK69_ELECQ|nr:hypothetical protein GDO78_005433 [Eleutherodactylus coqui]